MNNLVHSIPNIIQGNTLTDAYHKEDNGSLKKFEELVLEHEGKEGQWIVDVLFIHEGQFFTVKERRLWL